MFLDCDGFIVPAMVVQAYPRLNEWPCSGGGGRGGGVCRSCGSHISCSNGCGNGGQNTETPLFIKLATGEWAMLTRKQAAMGVRRDVDRHERGRGVAEGERVERGAVVARLERALRRAGRRSEFAAAMLGARAWMLAGHG